MHQAKIQTYLHQEDRLDLCRLSSYHHQNARRIYACRTRTVVVFLTPQQAGAAGLTAAVSESSSAKLLPEDLPLTYAGQRGESGVSYGWDASVPP